MEYIADVDMKMCRNYTGFDRSDALPIYRKDLFAVKM